MNHVIPPTPSATDEATIQRLITEVRDLEHRLALTQKWLERFQGAAAEKELEVHRLQEAFDKASADVVEGYPTIRQLRMLLVEADSNLGLVVHRYPRSGIPADLLEDMADLRRRIHPWVAARGRGETAHAAASKAVTETSAGSTPAAPTQEPYFGSCSGCHGCSNCKPL